MTKRQYTVHVFINTGDSEENTHGYADMICRGKGTRILQIERNAYNENVNMRWQKIHGLIGK